jgi:hypothetical protein
VVEVDDPLSSWNDSICFTISRHRSRHVIPSRARPSVRCSERVSGGCAQRRHSKHGGAQHHAAHHIPAVSWATIG